MKVYPYSFPESDALPPECSFDTPGTPLSELITLPSISVAKIDKTVSLVAFDSNYDLVLCRYQESGELVLVDNAYWEVESDYDGDLPVVDLAPYYKEALSTMA
jgi:hypothetical protein